MKASIDYRLSSPGQKAALAAGVPAQENHSVDIEIDAADVHFFNVDRSGSLSLDLSTEGGRERRYVGSSRWSDVLFDAPLTAKDILSFLHEREIARAAVESEEARIAVEKEQQETAQREAALAELRAKLADPAWHVRSNEYYLRFGDVSLHPSDPEPEIQEAFRRRDVFAAAERLMAAHLKDLPPKPVVRPTTFNASGEYSFTCPSSNKEKDWAKHVESIDASQSNGYAFVGPWLKPRATESLAAGELIVVGGSEWQGSRKRGSYVHVRHLYVVTSAGLCWVVSGDGTKAEAKALLALDPAERIEKVIAAAVTQCDESIGKCDSLDKVEYADISEDIVTVRAAWVERREAWIKASETATPDDRITDIDSAAAAIIAAGFKALSKTHHPDAGGSNETMALLSQARAQLRELLKMAVV